MPRSRIILILILVMMVLATGCSGRIKNQGAENLSEQEQISSQAGQNEIKDDSGANQSSEAGGNASNARQSSAEVVVKTGTKVSDEKASEILSDIDKQMDEVVNMLNNMDDVEESDLNF